MLAFDDNRHASVLFGQYGQNLALIERRLGVVAEQRGNHVTLDGSRDAVEQARRVLESLYENIKRGQDLASGDVEGAIRLAIAQGSLFDFDPAATRAGFEQINLRKRPVRARTTAQDAYIRALRRHALVFGTGPAGTGKTWLAVAHAVSLFERKEVDRIILSRPAVEAGERLGFLPGDLREKVDPYLRPIYDALHDLMDARIVERAMQTNEIEIAPLAFMRGRTLSNAVVILDEAQNTTAMQMKMFLTRLGENSRMIVTGDPSQVDLPPGQVSGLAEAMRLLDGVEGIGHAAFTAEDVVRHELVARIVAAYDKADARAGVGEGRGQRRDKGLSRAPSPALAAHARTGEARTNRRHCPLGALAQAADRQNHRQTGGFGRRRSRLNAAHRACYRAQPMIRRSRRSTAIGAAKTRPPTCCRFRPPAPGQSRSASPYIGDIVIAYQTVAREAVAEGKPFNHHLAHLAVHGFLHLLGYDHENDRDAQKMERLERKILKRLAVPDPYAPT